MSGSNSFSGKTLLIVEDEAYLREPLALEFESLGSRVFQASDGVEAFALVKREKIDLVISDVRMPGGDGLELLANIRAMPAPMPVVILMTGFSQCSLAGAPEQGAAAVVPKPFDLDVLQRTVERLLSADPVPAPGLHG